MTQRRPTSLPTEIVAIIARFAESDVEQVSLVCWQWYCASRHLLQNKLVHHKTKDKQRSSKRGETKKFTDALNHVNKAIGNAAWHVNILPFCFLYERLVKNVNKLYVFRPHWLSNSGGSSFLENWQHNRNSVNLSIVEFHTAFFEDDNTIPVLQILTAKYSQSFFTMDASTSRTTTTTTTSLSRKRSGLQILVFSPSSGDRPVVQLVERAIRSTAFRHVHTLYLSAHSGILKTGGDLLLKNLRLERMVYTIENQAMEIVDSDAIRHAFGGPERPRRGLTLQISKWDFVFQYAFWINCLDKVLYGIRYVEYDKSIPLRELDLADIVTLPRLKMDVSIYKNTMFHPKLCISKLTLVHPEINSDVIRDKSRYKHARVVKHIEAAAAAAV